MKIELKHVDNFKFKVVSEKFEMTIDQAHEYGGDGVGPMPSELLLWSIASCIGQSIVFVASKKGLELKNLRIHVEGNKNSETFRLDSIDVNIRTDNKSNVLEDILDIAKKYCFVSNTIINQVQVNYKTYGL